MTTLKDKIQNALKLRIGFVGYFMLFLQFFYMYQIAASNDTGGYSFSLGSIAIMVMSMGTVALFFLFIGSIFSFSRWAYILSVFVALGCYDLLVAYQFGAQEFVDWSFMFSNIDILFSDEALDVVISSMDEGALWYFPAFVVLFSVLEWRRKSLSNSMQTGSLRHKAVLTGVLYIIAVMVPIDSYDPFIHSFRSIKFHFFGDMTNLRTQAPVGHYLHYSSKFMSNTVSNPDQPTVFLIVVESLNARYIGKKSDNGREITPFMNQLQHGAVYVPTFYGNSIQTAKGHFATYFSMSNCLTGKEFRNYKTLNIESIASVLKQKGYRTVYFNAHHKRNFDNVSNFMTQRGYDEFEIVEPYLTDSDKANKLKWGVEDAVFYTRFFEYLDQQERRPHFVTLATIANHFPFNSMPDNRKLIYPEASSIRKHYANSVHLTDYGLQVFFEELQKRDYLENSLVIITGDHGFPLGEHGNYHLEAGYHEESFDVPLFIVWDGKLTPRRIERASSQMDIGPTILDLLSINGVVTNFQGDSVFSPENKPIYLVQPYGKQLSVVDYPLKYRFNTRLKKEFAYNLEKDPMETHNIWGDLSEAKQRFFRDHLKAIYMADEAIKRNQIR